MKILCLLAVINAISYGQTITISGKIKDPAGNPIGSCEVSQYSNKVLTKADGSFSITTDATSLHAKTYANYQVQIARNILAYSIYSPSRVRITLEDIRGKSLFNVTHDRKEPGNYKMDLSEWFKGLSPSSLYLLRFRIDEQSVAFKVLPSQGNSAYAEVTRQESQPLVKASATPGDLKVRCASSLPKFIAIGNTSANLGDIVIKKANVLLLYADDMNDWTSLSNNWAKTPNLEKFAKTGVYFERAQSMAQECNPSRTATLLGKRPGTTGMYWNDHDFRNPAHANDASISKMITLPQYFKNRGYETKSFGKIFHQPAGAMSDPISWVSQTTSAGTPTPAIYKSNPWHNNDFGQLGVADDYNDGAFLFGPMDSPEQDAADSKNAALARDHIIAQNSKPWFVAYGSFRPHASLVAPKRFFDLYPLNEIQTPDTIANDLDDVPKVGRDVALNWGKPIQPVVLKYGVWKQALQGYKACVSYMDYNMGVILDALDASPERDNTLVIFLSDHGVHLGEKQHWWKMTLWRQTTHIPFLIRVPGLTHPGTRNGSTIDMSSLYPTVLDILNLPADSLNLEGKSLSPILENPDLAWDTPGVTTAGYKNHSVVSKDFRYIQYNDGTEELYDIHADSLEFHNLAGNPAYAATISKLKAFLPKLNVPDVLKP